MKICFPPPHRLRSHRGRVLAFLVALLPVPGFALSLSAFNTPMLEAFDSLAVTGTSATLPSDWSLLESGTGANATYAAGTGSSSTGNSYSFGTSGSSERALGALRTSSLFSVIGTRVTNQTGDFIASLLLAYTGEQWRLGAAGRIDRLDFAYSLDATTLANGTWTDVDALDFTAPTTAGTVGALNGNAAVNQTGISHLLSGLGLAPGGSLMMRWADFDATGSDDGLAIDDFSITAVSPAPAAIPDHLPPGWPALAVGGVLWWAARSRRPATWQPSFRSSSTTPGRR